MRKVKKAMGTIESLKSAICEMQRVDKNKSRLRMGKPRTEGYSEQEVQKAIHAARDEFLALLKSLDKAQGIKVISRITTANFLSIESLIDCYESEINVGWDASGLQAHAKIVEAAIK